MLSDLLGLVRDIRRFTRDARVLLRVVARAALAQSPGTEVSVHEIALVLGRDPKAMRRARPDDARQPGSAIVARWRDWQEALDGETAEDTGPDRARSPAGGGDEQQGQDSSGVVLAHPSTRADAASPAGKARGGGSRRRRAASRPSDSLGEWRPKPRSKRG